MALSQQVGVTFAFAVSILALLVVVVIGWNRFFDALRGYRPRVASVFPYLVVVTLALLIRAITQEWAEDLTWLIDLELTSLIFYLEGDLIGRFQGIATPELSAYFGFMYIYGYTALIAFPAIAYFCLPSMQHLKELLVAYVVNNAVGIFFYVTFISFGPRQLGRGLVDPILYDIYPEAALITGSVNIPINVFPSLHASMAATVMFFAWRTRAIYPVWAVIASVYALSVIVSTMYLGIHWATDVLAGTLLAVGAVYIGIYLVKHESRLSVVTRRVRPGV